MLKNHLQTPAYYRSKHVVYLFSHEDDMNLAMSYPGVEEDAGPTGFIITDYPGRYKTQSLTVEGDLDYWHNKLGFVIKAIEPEQNIFIVEVKDFEENTLKVFGASKLTNIIQRKWVGARVICNEDIGWIVPRYWMSLNLIEPNNA